MFRFFRNLIFWIWDWTVKHEKLEINGKWSRLTRITKTSWAQSKIFPCVWPQIALQNAYDFLAWLGQSFHLGKKKVTLILITVPQLHSVICLSRSWATSWFSTSDPSLPLASTWTLSISMASPIWAILLKSWINQFTFCEQCDQMYSLFFNICYSTVQQWTFAQQHSNLLD